MLIGYGISTMSGHGFYSSNDARNNINHVFGPGHHTRVNDFLQLAPYFELGKVLLAGIKSHDDQLTMGLIILKSEAITLASVYTMKELANIDRPPQHLSDGTHSASIFGGNHQCTRNCGKRTPGTISDSLFKEQSYLSAFFNSAAACSIADLVPGTWLSGFNKPQS